ncbi:MAG: FtsX-like permease family protein [Acidimicrobiales bacterium]
MNVRALRVAGYRIRARLRRRGSGYLGLVLVIGLIGGVALGAVAGARRTESSFPIYEASTNPSTVGVFSRYLIPKFGMLTGYSPREANLISHLPNVERAANAIVFDANMDLTSVKGLHYRPVAGEGPPAFVGSFDGEFTAVDRMTLVAGRRAIATRRDEAVMTVEAAREMGLHVGSVIRVPFYTDAEVLSPKSFKPHYVASITMVGEVVASRDVVESDLNRLKSAAVIFSPALTRFLALDSSTGTETFLQVRGGNRNAKRVLNELYRLEPVIAQFPAEITSQGIPTVQAAITPEAVALGVFGGIAGLSLLLVAGLMIGRLMSAGRDATGSMRALGATRSMMHADELLGVLAATVGGVLVAVVVAVCLSPLTPLGPVRPVYPQPGVALDGTVLGLGSVSLLVLLAFLAIVLARREVRAVTSNRASRPWRSERPWLRRVASSGLPVSVVAGFRFALESGRGRNTAPVRAALIGAVLAVTVLVTTVTFGASLNGLVSRPALYGWNWDYVLISAFTGAEDLPGPLTAKLLNADADVQAWSGASFATARLDGQRVAVLTEKPGARVAPPVLTGHGLRSAHQVVLGGATLAQLHKHVGDTVTFSNGVSKPQALRIVGTATMPAIGGGLGMGDGAWVATEDFPVALLNLQSSAIPGPNAVLVRVRAGVSRAAALRSLGRVNTEINRVPSSNGSAGGVVSVLRPIEIVNFRSMGTAPTVFAATLAAGALVALGLTIGASVRRRRRELALLKALGLTRRQVAAAISWQATVAAVVGVVVGVPSGILIGGQLWDLFARNIHAVPAPTTPAVVTTLVALGALGFANLVAALPGRSAARTPVALVLRAE